MPTTDIIGYLWSNRQELELDGLPDVIHMAGDLQHIGLACVEISEISVFGISLETRSSLVLRTTEEWADLVHKAILSSAIEHTVDMLHVSGGDDE